MAPPILISSTDVRAAVAEGFPIEGAVPPAVARYIHEHGLYRNA
jgi:nicotinic acid mononucleotide adenylyltransferase